MILPSIVAPIHAIVPLKVLNARIEFVGIIVVPLLREIHAHAPPHSVVDRKTIKAVKQGIINCLPFS